MLREDQTSSIAVIGLLSSCAMLTVVLLKKSAVQQKPSHFPRGQTSEVFRAGLQTTELWFAEIL